MEIDDQFDQLNALLEQFGTKGVRQISLESERIPDNVFLRICSSGKKIGLDQFTDILEALLERFSSCGEKHELGERASVVREIISEVLARIDNFSTLEQYIWLVKFSCGLSLLKDLPPDMTFEINKTIRSVANLDTEEYEFDALMIHTIAKSLFEDIPLEGMNLIHVIKKLAMLNQKLFYYVSIALIFAGIRHYIEPEKVVQVYRLYDFQEVLSLLDGFKVDSLQQKLDLRRMFLILKLLSCYQNAVILRHSCETPKDIDEQHQCFAQFFLFSVEQKKSYLLWLCMSRKIVQSLNSKLGLQNIAEKEDSLLVIELIDLDMIALMEDDISENK
ncbi:uncharacterized protein LOC129762461 isoform X2 [Toxorhynchites rutilus septentrionalis]|uniref:uncharacterized protein LOC129762461 isoform X2 n=1 Tax=Toxorhynchites rutilus septentrionalis TaxID=329112 RepID=UPI0024785C8A|nr:uncharacterized protein LOC129762461 isoform X2 [Toxorhynchites rutilus septentrionalis]